MSFCIVAIQLLYVGYFIFDIHPDLKFEGRIWHDLELINVAYHNMDETTQAPEIIDITDEPSFHTEYGVVGLINLGNTCYANSVVQVLRSIPAFTHLILKDRLTVSDSANQTLKEFWEAFVQLTKQIWKNHRGVTVRPINYLKAICNLVKDTVYEDFGTNMPNDAHEYYTFLLDKFQLATHSPQKQLPASATDSERAWHSSFQKDYSNLVPFFYGQLKRTIQCQQCKNETITYEIFNTIKVNLKENNEPLIDSIASTFAAEEMDDYRCDKCASWQKAIITPTIIKTPPYLSITINRFINGFQEGRKDTKIFTLDNDEFLDLSSVITDDTNKKYSLMSMIDHHGSMRGGHYLCHIKHVPESELSDSEISNGHTWQEGPKPGQWYLYDDDSVYASSKPHISQSTYMIFLRRI